MSAHEAGTSELRMVRPTGEQLYMMVVKGFKNGYFPWSMVPDSTKAAWETAAADLVFAPDTIMNQFGKAGS